MIKLSFSQNIQPQLILFKGDTFCLSPIKNIERSNIKFVKLDFERRLSDSLISIKKSLKQTIADRDQLKGSYENQLQLKDQALNESDIIIANDKAIQGKDVRKIKWLKVQRNTLFVVIVVAATKIFLVH